MRIIKKGVIRQTVYKGTCRECGTQFEADTTEVQRQSGDYSSKDPREQADWYSYPCPLCGTQTYMQAERKLF